MKTKIITSKLEPKLLNDLKDGDYFGHPGNIKHENNVLGIYQKIGKNKAKVIDDYSIENREGNIVQHDNFEVVPLKIMDKIGVVDFQLSQEILLEQGILESPDDFEDFLEYIEHREGYHFEDDTELLSDYASDFYYKKDLLRRS